MSYSKLKIKMYDGSEWVCATDKIAEKIADYYACEVDKHEKFSEHWYREKQQALDDSFILVDFVYNNMNWEDLDAIMIKQPTKQNDYKRMFLESEITALVK